MIKGTLELNIADLDALVRAYAAEHMGLEVTGYTVHSHSTEILLVDGDTMRYPAVHRITQKSITIEGLKK